MAGVVFPRGHPTVLSSYPADFSACEVCITFKNHLPTMPGDLPSSLNFQLSCSCSHASAFMTLLSLVHVSKHLLEARVSLPFGAAPALF